MSVGSTRGSIWQRSLETACRLSGLVPWDPVLEIFAYQIRAFSDFGLHLFDIVSDILKVPFAASLVAFRNVPVESTPVSKLQKATGARVTRNPVVERRPPAMQLETVYRELLFGRVSRLAITTLVDGVCCTEGFRDGPDRALVRKRVFHEREKSPASFRRVSLEASGPRA